MSQYVGTIWGWLGNPKASTRLFQRIAASGTQKAAEASYQLGQLAKDRIDFEAAWQALTHAVDSGAKAVDLVYHASGTSAIFTSNPLERYFRDIHVATQHRFASPQEIYKVGAILLGAAQ